MTRLLFFGSSNTERRIPGMHWSDTLDLAIKGRFNRVHHCINAGRGGDRADQLLARFEEQAAVYQPHFVFITVGGNDFVQNVPEEEFRANLLELHRRFTALGAAVIFQTYYSPDPELCQEDERLRDLTRFYRFMEVIREVAAETGSALVDQLRRWELLRIHHPEAYRPLMRDAMHVTEEGNRLMGLELVRLCGLSEALDTARISTPGYWDAARRLQQLMDACDPARA